MERTNVGRMRKRGAVAATAALGTASLLLAACSGGDASGSSEDDEDVIVLKYAFYAPQASFPGVQMDEWARLLNERTDGRVEVETYPGSTLLGTGDIYDGVLEGVVDVGLDSPHNDSSRYPFSAVMNLPLGIPDAQVGSAVYLELLEEFEPAEFDGFEVITAFTSEPAHVLTSSEVAGAEDVVGLELRAPGPLMGLAEELGISPVSMSTPEVAEGMQTGLVAGTLSSRDVLKDLGLGEIVDYMIDYPLALGGTFVAVMDAERFAALPEEVQTEIRDLKREMMEFASSYHDDVNVAESVAWTETEHGLTTVELSESERAEWDAITSRISDEWAAQYAGAEFDAREVLDRTRELIAEKLDDGA